MKAEEIIILILVICCGILGACLLAEVSENSIARQSMCEELFKRTKTPQDSLIVVGKFHSCQAVLPK